MEAQVWTVKLILEWIEGFLARHGDQNPKLSAQWLVSEVLGKSRIQLFMDQECPLSMEERDTLREFTRRRASGEPLQYITGTTDFRFITVMVEHGVLIPRPETEVLVSEALVQLDTAACVKAARRAKAAKADACIFTLQEAGNIDEDTFEHEQAAEEYPEELSEPTMNVLDICTGTGCIACSIASEVPYAQVVATDIDPKAVALARKNAEALSLTERVTVLECDLCEGVDSSLMGSFNLVISNPPYIPTGILNCMDAEVTDHESFLALDGGADGLDVFRRILPLAIEALCDGGVLAMELHETCLDKAAKEAKQAGYANVRIAQDLAGRPRVLIAQKG